jgi:hypothetical protein
MDQGGGNLTRNTSYGQRCINGQSICGERVGVSDTFQHFKLYFSSSTIFVVAQSLLDGNDILNFIN